ncbi:hypothetical protein [Methylocystis sp. MJC1]
MRLGAPFGDGAVVELKFNTMDVFVVMPVEEIGRATLNIRSA